MGPFDFLNTTGEINNAVPIHDTFDPYFWSLMAFNLVCIAFIRSTHPNYLRILFNTALNNRHLINNTRDDLNLSRPVAILLNLIYFNAFAVIIAKIAHIRLDYALLAISGILVGLAFFKLAVMRIIAFLSNERSGIYEHMLNHLIFFQVAGIILTPILIFTHYLPASYEQPVIIGLTILVSVFILIREFHSFVRAVQSKVSMFYIILYLCTLELLPIIVGIRVLIFNNEAIN